MGFFAAGFSDVNCEPQTGGIDARLRDAVFDSGQKTAPVAFVQFANDSFDFEFCVTLQDKDVFGPILIVILTVGGRLASAQDALDADIV